MEIEKINKKIKDLELEKKAINHSIKLKKRKERTRKLIQKGALLEKYFNIENLSVEETEELLKVFANYVKANMPNKFKKG